MTAAELKNNAHSHVLLYITTNRERKLLACELQSCEGTGNMCRLYEGWWAEDGMAAALCHGKCKPLADRNNCWTCGDMTDGWCCMVNASGFRCPYEPEVLELLEHEAPYAAAAE